MWQFFLQLTLSYERNYSPDKYNRPRGCTKLVVIKLVFIIEYVNYLTNTVPPFSLIILVMDEGVYCVS